VPSEHSEIPVPPPPAKPAAWDCRLCTRPDNTEEVCGYCGNPQDANESFPPLPPQRRDGRLAHRVRPYLRGFADPETEPP